MSVRTPFAAVRGLATRLGGDASDYDALLELAADRRFVLLGEATHGTAEFYRMRAQITERLIAELGFDGVAVEGDWPDCWRVNRFVQGRGGEGPEEAFGNFDRFPRWMWRNREVLEFARRLHAWNAGQGHATRAGFYGLDLYSLYRSADAVIAYLERVDPEQAAVARRRYACLDHVRDPQAYGFQAAYALRPACREAAVEQLLELQAATAAHLARNGEPARDAQFFALRNAAVVANAESYYREMFGARANTWNLRDAHMCDTLLALSDYRRERGGSGRVVVWAHNSHLGDARATSMGRAGEWNVGQLLRERAGGGALLVGFTTYTGFVSAASAWDGEVEHKRVRPALQGSYERLFYETRLDRFFLPLVGDAAAPLREGMLERAIGVIYLPHSERASHYFDASLAAQFDAVFHLDETSALEPLDVSVQRRRREAPETYPFGV